MASGFSGLFVSVLDGDVFDIQHKRGVERVRLKGIAAPEKGQAYGRHAQQFVEEMALGKHVIIRRSHIYRRVDCQDYDIVSEASRIAFVSVDAAEQTGYRVDWNCP